EGRLPGQRVGIAGARVHRFAARRFGRPAELAAEPELRRALAQRPFRGAFRGDRQVVLQRRIGQAVGAQRRRQPAHRDHALHHRADRGLRLDRHEQAGARAAIGEVQRTTQRAGGATVVVVARDQVGGPVLAAPLPPDAVGPGDVEVGAVVLVQRLLHDVVDAERGLEAAQAQAPGRLCRPVFEVGLVDGRLAVLEARGPRGVGAHPELFVVLFAVQAGGHAAAGVPAVAEFATHAEARPGTHAVGVGGAAAAGAGFGADIAEAHVAAGL